MPGTDSYDQIASKEAQPVVVPTRPTCKIRLNDGSSMSARDQLEHRGAESSSILTRPPMTVDSHCVANSGCFRTQSHASRTETERPSIASKHQSLHDRDCSPCIPVAPHTIAEGEHDYCFCGTDLAAIGTARRRPLVGSMHAISMYKHGDDCMRSPLLPSVSRNR